MIFNFYYFLNRKKMQSRINKRITSYLQEFKQNICQEIKNGITHQSQLSNIIQFVYDYDGLEITKEDIQKKQRKKNVICVSERCIAKKSSGEQCTRRRKDNIEFCGTHEKGQPHGVITNISGIIASEIEQGRKVEVYTEEVDGIVYYIDKENNVYNTDDVFRNIEKPRIIGKYVNGVIERY